MAVCAVAAPAAADRRDRIETDDETGGARVGTDGGQGDGKSLGGRDWQRWAALALGFGVPYLALAAAAGHDPWHALRTALALHHQIAVAPRSYATWLLWNPYDFALLLSPGVLGLAAAALLPGTWRHASEASPRGTAARPAIGLLAAWTWWGLLALLLLSGGVRGEAGRIWLLWMPFACLFAAAAVAAGGPHRAGRSLAAAEPEPQEPARLAGGWWGIGLALLLATEAALTLALAARMIFVSPN